MPVLSAAFAVLALDRGLEVAFAIFLTVAIVCTLAYELLERRERTRRDR